MLLHSQDQLTNYLPVLQTEYQTKASQEAAQGGYINGLALAHVIGQVNEQLEDLGLGEEVILLDVKGQLIRVSARHLLLPAPHLHLADQEVAG